MPLWLRAQPFRLICYGNPFQEGIRSELFDAELDKIIDKKEIVFFQCICRFLFVETLKPFVPKVKYPKPSKYKRIFVNHN